MPPNADHIRNRVPVIKLGVNSDDTSEIRLISKKDLADNEVAIEGVVYDINSFIHPGGNQFRVMAGNDVTVQYKMIHPHHTGKQLEKMRVVGKLVDYAPEYEFDTPFERELKKEVFKIVRRGREFGTPGFIFRACFYVALLIVLQLVWVCFGSTWTLAIALGISKAFIGLNVQHDANHGAVSRNPFWNDVLGYGADFIGGSKYTWLAQHWTHHAYTNHADMDPDSFSAEPMLLFNDYKPSHPARKFYHKLQGLYFLFVLSFYWVSSVFNPQIIDLKQRGAQFVGINLDGSFLKSARPTSHFLRLLYIFNNCVTPFLHHGICLEAFGHIWLMGAMESLMLSVLFACSHNFEQVDRDPTKDFKENGKRVCWYKSQVETSSTYGGVISGWLTGGLNHQVEHHLFPRMSSAWYPYIRETVQKVCEKHGVRYVYYPYLTQNLLSLFKYMHAAGNGSNWMENPLTGRA